MQLYDFLNSSLGIFILGSVLVPLILQWYEGVKNRIVEQNENDLRLQECIYRYSKIEGVFERGERNYPLIRNLLNGVVSLLPQFKDTTIEGLLFLAMPAEASGVMPKEVNNIEKFNNILNELGIRNTDSDNTEALYQQHKDEVEAILNALREDKMNCISHLS